MMGMTKFVCFVLALLSVSPGVAKSESQRTPDGRFGTPCYTRGDGTNKDLCRVSFGHLISRPERYDGRVIAVRGFLIKLFGDRVLFQNKESYDSGSDIEGIELSGSIDLPENVASKLEDGIFPVIVVGIFDAKYTGISFSRLGAMRDISRVMYAPRMTD